MAVKIFGHTISTPAAVAIAGGSAIAIWFAYKQHKDSEAAAAGSSSSSIDPVTGLPYSQDNQIDPLTGMTYLAEAQEYGSVSAAEQAVAGEAADETSTADETGSDLSDLSGVGTGTVSTDVSGGAYASNAAWAQAVTAGLSNIGYTSTDVSAALGMYLGGLPLSTLADGVSSASIVEAAIAEYGPPPVGSFTITLPSTTTTTTPPPTTTTTTPPPTTTTTTTTPPPTTTTTPPPTTTTTPPVNNSWSFPAPTGFTAWKVASNGYYLRWNPVTGPDGQQPESYQIRTYTSAGKEVDDFNTGAGSTETSEFGPGQNGLPKGTYKTQIWANGGPVAPAGSVVTVTITA